MTDKIAIVACTGMGKILASVGRYAALYLTKTLRPESTINICLPCVVADDKSELDLLHNHPIVIMDGCSHTCAYKLINNPENNIIAHLKIWQLMAKHKDLKPDSRVNIGEGGIELGKLIAQEAARKIDEYLSGK